MTEAILSALWVGTALFFIIREIKVKEHRESHEYWLFELRECLHSIENEFKRKCQDIITNSFSGRNVSGGVVIDKYYEEITALEKAYKNNLYEMVVSRGWQYKITSVPEYLEKEYERNISEIADSFQHWGDFMLEQVKDITKEDVHWRMKL